MKLADRVKNALIDERAAVQCRRDHASMGTNPVGRDHAECRVVALAAGGKVVCLSRKNQSAETIPLRLS